MKACSARMSLEWVRQGHEEDDSEATDGDDDRRPGVHGDDVAANALAESQVADDPELERERLRQSRFDNLKAHPRNATHNFISDRSGSDRNSDHLVHPRLSVKLEFVETSKDLWRRTAT